MSAQYFLNLVGLPLVLDNLAHLSTLVEAAILKLLHYDIQGSFLAQFLFNSSPLPPAKFEGRVFFITVIIDDHIYYRLFVHPLFALISLPQCSLSTPERGPSWLTNLEIRAARSP